MRELRILLFAFMALAFGAFILLFVLSEHTDDWFSWTIKPPLTAAFLGASYLGAFILFAWTARRGDWESARAALVPVTVIALLLLVATIIHEDRFHDDLFGWFWRIVYLLTPVAIAAALAHQLRPRSRGRRAPAGDLPEPRSPLPAGLRALLLFQGITMLAIGVYMFVAPESADALWPWDLTPLTARAVGSFVTGFGVSALHATAANDLTRFSGAAAAYAGLAAMQLVAVVRYPDDMTGSDVDTALYVAFLFSVLLAGLYGLSCVRRSSSSAASRSA
jgi:hypothetical protein